MDVDVLGAKPTEDVDVLGPVDYLVVEFPADGPTSRARSQPSCVP